MRRSGSATAASTKLGFGVVVHYHEVGLKGRNRGRFERRLVRNLEDALRGCTHEGIEVLPGRFIIHTPGPPSEGLLAAVGRTFGVAVYAPCALVPPEVPRFTEAALGLLPRGFGTFAVAARRATKAFPRTSHDMNVEMGAAIQEATGAGVDLTAPDARVHVEATADRGIVYVDRRPGPGGLPVGVSGPLVCLLSGGIDSPVAVYRMLKRGAVATLCHFHSAPFTDRSSIRKATELAERIASWQGNTALYLVPLGTAQQQIVLVAPPALRVVLYRRLMVRVAAQIAEREECKALVTGDSLGQVASQTLDNMLCVEDASELPLLRPLIGSDKQEIVDEARRIGTYDLSVLPYEDCCTLFVPRQPATRAEVSECRDAESSLDVPGLVGACVDEAERIEVERPACSDGGDG